MKSENPFQLPIKIGCWLMVFVGSFLLIAGLVSAVHTVRFLRRSAAAAGTVVRFKTGHHAENGAPDYAPVFSYTASNGQSYVLESHNYSGPPEFSIGQNVRVLYERAHPEHAKIDTYWQIWAIEDVSGLVGGLFVASGLGLLQLLAWRNRRRLSELTAGHVFVPR
jgi:hypothetical protein